MSPWPELRPRQGPFMQDPGTGNDWVTTAEYRAAGRQAAGGGRMAAPVHCAAQCSAGTGCCGATGNTRR